MSDKTPVCTGRMYRGHVLVTVLADGASRVVVMDTRPGQAARLFECVTIGEAEALVDAAHSLEAAARLPLDGGARATAVVDGPMQSV